MIDFSGSRDDFLSVLEPFQREAIAELEASGLSDEAIIDCWLQDVGMSNIRGHGALRGVDGFSSRFRREFRDFVCTNDPRYSDLRRTIKKHGEKLNYTSAAAISIAIASYIGVASVLLVPVVALTSSTVARLGKNAWCRER